MKNRFLFLFLSFALALGASAQSADSRIKLRQLQIGTEGQMIKYGSDGNLAPFNPNFFVYGDTVLKIATKYDLLNVSGFRVVSGSMNTSNGTITMSYNNGQTFSFGTAGYAIPLAQKGVINGVTPLGADGKVPPIYLPALPGRNTFVVNSEAAMLATGAIKGDEAIRTDVSQSYVLQNEPATTLSNWVLRPNPGGYVKTVNNKNGENVTLTTDDIPQGSTNLYFSNILARAALSGSGAIGFNQSTGVISHNNSGINPGTYNTITFDANGHATAGSNVAYLTNSSLGNYYTKTELQTPGQALVDWQNIKAKPSNLGAQEVKQTVTGGTSGVITMTQTPLYPSAALIFLNGVLLDNVDYSISGNTLTLGFTREASDRITYKFSY